MYNDPICYKIKFAIRKLMAATDHLTDVLAMPESRLLDAKHRHLLQTTRNNIRRQWKVLNAVLPAAVDATYVQPRLPDQALDALAQVQEALESPSPHNAEPPRPE